MPLHASDRSSASISLKGLDLEGAHLQISACELHSELSACKLGIRASSLCIAMYSPQSQQPALRCAGNHDALQQGPALLFLHLLGLDSQSHAHGGPHARQYLDNIELVDRGVSELVRQIERTFYDKATAYLVTSDHGCANCKSTV